MTTRVCPGCGKEYTTLRRSMYCDPVCAMNQHRARRVKKKKELRGKKLATCIYGGSTCSAYINEEPIIGLLSKHSKLLNRG